MESLKVVENCFVSPPPGSVPTTTIPLTFFDLHWLGFSPMQRLFFYEFNLTETTLSNLKTSLSLSLHHFFPLAGKIIFPTPPQHPYISYTDGDSVHLRVVESTADFNHLVGNHGRDSKELQDLVMKLPREAVMAVQVTVFPNSGISIGITYNHMVADGRAIDHFRKSWASICKAQGDPNSSLGSNPIHNRDLITDSKGLASIFVNQSWESVNLSGDNPPQKLQITVIISRSQIEILKNWAKKKSTEEDLEIPLRISTFTVTCAYMWVCLAKLQEREISGDSGDKLYHFIFLADCAGRLKLPETYFGNCLEPRFAAAKRRDLTGENGVLAAVKAIGREILELEKGALRGAEQWLSKPIEIIKSGRFLVSVAGSPKLRVYETDFGWGMPKKVEVAHIGSSGGAIAITESRDEEGGVEFGVALALDEVERFNVMFQQGFLKHID